MTLLLVLATAEGARAVPPHPTAPASSKPAGFAGALAKGLDRPALRPAALPRRVLILLVDFSDEPRAGNLTREAIEAAFLADQGSVREYFERSSFGRYQLEGETTDWLRLPEPLLFYSDGRSGVGGTYPRNARRMVEDAVRAADPFVDFSLFDNDGPDGIPASADDDGEVDALVVVHAGDGAEYGNTNNILSHSWFTEDPVPTDEGPFVWGYATVAETSPLGVRAHELGHLLGLPDLYDRSSVFAGAAGGLGDWSLMAAGAWLGDGRTPADLDAASKIQLGFVTPTVPQTNASNLPLRVSRNGEPPDVYQVWTRGAIGDEFFVIENRRPENLDRALPAGGLLLYHVNLLQANNDDANDLRVQLLQADGLEQIEGFQSNGDDGDPFPGSRGVVSIDDSGTPNTRARDGSDSQVVLSNISLPTASMSFDLQIESTPFLQIAQHAVVEMVGDGDGIPEALEQLQLEVTFENLGEVSGDINVQWRTEPVEQATWSVATAVLPALAKHENVVSRFVLTPSATVADPGALELRAELSQAGSFEQVLRLVVGIGEVKGFVACLDALASRFTRDCPDLEGEWQSRSLRGSDSWTLEESEGDLGSIYRSASGSRYANAVDLVLISPAFNLQPRSVLQLLHAFDIEDLEAGWSMDGARVELSLAGGAWQTLAPEAGYPRRLYPESIPYLAAQPVFAGRSERRWDRFDLGERSGSARLRFRLVSNASIAARGWEIVRVEVKPAAEAPRRSLLSLVAEPNPVAFPARVAFKVEGDRRLAARATRLRLFDIRGRLVRTLQHVAVPAQTGRFLWDGTDREGKRVPSGIYVARLEWGGQTAVAKLLVVR